MSFTQNEDEMVNIIENHCNVCHSIIIVPDEIDRHHGHHHVNLDVHHDLHHHLYNYYDYHHFLQFDHHILLEKKQSVNDE